MKLGQERVTVVGGVLWTRWIPGCSAVKEPRVADVTLIGCGVSGPVPEATVKTLECFLLKQKVMRGR